MAKGERIIFPAQMLPQDGGDDHLTVLPTGATDSQGEMRLAFFPVVGQEKVHKPEQVVEKSLGFRMIQNILLDPGGFSGKWLQSLHKVRVRQEPHIQHHVGFRGNALLIGKRDEMNPHPLAGRQL
jgi:hypothetical protein